MTSSVNVHRPARMRIEEARCSECGACLELAPVIASNRQDIPISPATLDAMSECPTGALVWAETEETESNEAGG